jgi:hypothetical protein
VAYPGLSGSLPDFVATECLFMVADQRRYELGTRCILTMVLPRQEDALPESVTSGAQPQEEAQR